MNIQTLATLTGMERGFMLFLCIGLLGYILKRYHLFPSWNIKAFVKAEGYGILRSCVLAVGSAYFLPDLLLLAREKQEVLAIVEQHPALMEKFLHGVAALLGYTGGSIAFDIIKGLYRLPVIGPLLEQAVEKLRARLRPQPARR